MEMGRDGDAQVSRRGKVDGAAKVRVSSPHANETHESPLDFEICFSVRIGALNTRCGLVLSVCVSAEYLPCRRDTHHHFDGSI